MSDAKSSNNAHVQENANFYAKKNAKYHKIMQELSDGKSYYELYIAEGDKEPRYWLTELGKEALLKCSICDEEYKETEKFLEKGLYSLAFTGMRSMPRRISTQDLSLPVDFPKRDSELTDFIYTIVCLRNLCFYDLPSIPPKQRELCPTDKEAGMELATFGKKNSH